MYKKFEITVDQNNKTKYTGVLHPLVNIFRIQRYTKTPQNQSNRNVQKHQVPDPKIRLKKHYIDLNQKEIKRLPMNQY